MAALGSATRALSDPGSDVHLAGAMASIVGRLGPEAEAVLGPGMRRTAYRYRGTERRPDANMRAATGRANNLAASLEQERWVRQVIESGETCDGFASGEARCRPPGSPAGQEGSFHHS